MSEKKEMRNTTWGTLTVVSEADEEQYGKSIWVCQCSCGRTSLVNSYSLQSGNTKSCGHCYDNVYEIYENFAVLHVKNGRTFKISLQSLDKVKGYQFCTDVKGYAMTRINGKTVYLHRILLEPSENQVVDHIDGDISNCRMENLRVCSFQENAFNQQKHPNNTSGYKGVDFDKRRKKYRVRIRTSVGRLHLGYFLTSIDAAQAYDEAALKYHGTFARLNFPENQDIRSVL